MWDVASFELVVQNSAYGLQWRKNPISFVYMYYSNLRVWFNGKKVPEQEE